MVWLIPIIGVGALTTFFGTAAYIVGVEGGICPPENIWLYTPFVICDTLCVGLILLTILRYCRLKSLPKTGDA